MKNSDKNLNHLISKKLYEYRMENSYSQELMAEKLNISPRSYWEQEKGKSGFSGKTICRFLCILPPEEVIKLIHVLRTEVWKDDYE
ncbi:MAG: helix-turn-helix transcriptional regulator [Clostridiales bacterium]|uniref:Helix-turn-helix domain-containing protein n=1 Tax=Candidatus Anaerobutyricum stercoripullorum TaxID=2838456 RepID=A0A9D1X4M1_9FIRM|nr:helix-turn-helix transcriptional regulator [Clostridiales bacterium]HIX72472.1 helix-turn-helix domain-containing protein [Candidatus Anaerobutyricum stercoripullorum]